MKLFTVEEANRMLPDVRIKLITIRRLHESLSTYRERARAAASASEFGGGMPGGTIYVKALYEIGKITAAIQESGIQIKDYARGLIDFPSLRDGRIVLLCWQLDESETIEWWHETEAGFAGRRLL